MWERGRDTEYGGLFYFRDIHDWHDMKFPWPHHERIIATPLAWQGAGESWDQPVADFYYALTGIHNLLRK